MSSISKVARLANLAVIKSSIISSSRSTCFSSIRLQYLQKLKYRSFSVNNIRCLATAAAVSPKISDEQNHVSQQRTFNNKIQSSPSIDRNLHLLDSQVQKWNRVDSDEVYSVIKLVDEVKILTSQQAVMILRCLGSLMVKETPAVRHQMFLKCWKNFSEYGVTYNVSHYNAALRVQLENSAAFDSVAFLGEMQANSILPNRITYQLLIAHFCNTGDIEGAKKILDHMKTEQLAINSSVFNSLVKGHMFNKDKTGALSVIASMKQAGLEPNADTYSAMMIGYAGQSDITAIREQIGVAEGDGVFIDARRLFSVIFEYATKGEASSNEISELLSLLNSTHSYNQEAANCMFSLVAVGKDDAALQVYEAMSRPNVDNDTNLGRILLRHMVVMERPYDKVKQILEKLKVKGLSKDETSMLALWSLRAKNVPYSLDIFADMKLSKLDLKPHYYWPLFRACEESASKSDLSLTLKSFSTNTDTVNENELFITLNQYVKPALISCSMDFAILEECGISKRLSNGIRLSESLFSGNMENALNLAGQECYISPSMLKSTLVGIFKTGGQEASIAQILAFSQPKSSMPDVNTNILENCSNVKSTEKVIFSTLVQSFVDKKLIIYKDVKDGLKDKFSAETDLIKILEKLESQVDRNVNQTSRMPMLATQDFMKTSIPKLEELLAEAKEKKSHVSKSIEKWLLSKYCSKGDVVKALEIKASLDGQGFVYNAELLRQLSYLAARFQHDLPLSLKYLQQLENQHPDFSQYISLVLHVAKLQINESKTADALETLKQYHSRHGDSVSRDITDGYILSDVCGELVDACRKQAEPADVKALVSALFNYGYMKKGTYSILKQTILAYVEKDDVEGSLEALKQAITEFGRTPYYHEIFKMLIRKENADGLQTAVDIASSINGEMTVLLKLAVCFVECGKIKQAQKIIDTPGLRALMPVIRESINDFIMNDKTKELDNLVEVTKDLYALDKDEMLFSQIRMAAKANDYARALDVYSSYEELNVKPRPRSLRLLAKLLTSHDQPIPFELPAETRAQQEKVKVQTINHNRQIKKNEILSTSRSEEEASLKHVQDSDFEAFNNLLQQCKKDGVSLSEDFLCRLIVHFQTNSKAFRSICYILEENNELNTLQSLSNNKDMNTKVKDFISKRYVNTLIKSGKSEEAINLIFKEENNVNTHLSLDTFRLLKSVNVAQFDKLKEKILSTTTSDYLISNGYLFNYYVINDQMDEAKKIEKKSEIVNSANQMSFICRECEKQNKVSELEELLKLSEPSKRGIVYSSLINVQCRNKDSKAASEVFARSQKAWVPLDDLYISSLKLFETLLKSESKPIPFEADYIVTRRKRKNSQTKIEPSSSSSSSSSSDEDKKKSSDKQK